MNVNNVPRRQKALQPIAADIAAAVNQLHDGIELRPRSVSTPWTGSLVYVVPPAGEPSFEWVRRAVAESNYRRVVMLLPALPETMGGQLALKKCRSVVFVAGARLMVIGFGVDLSPLASFGAVLFPKAAP